MSHSRHHDWHVVDELHHIEARCYDDTYEVRYTDNPDEITSYTPQEFDQLLQFLGSSGTSKEVT